MPELCRFYGDGRVYQDCPVRVRRKYAIGSIGSQIYPGLPGQSEI